MNQDHKDILKTYKTISPTELSKTQASSQTSSQTLQKKVPVFLHKLYSMVNDSESDKLICWTDNGTSFFINDQEELARKVLPRFFKHNKFTSFVRQLNMYGFHKVPHLQQGALESDCSSERWEFSNPHFQRNRPELLLLVTRKKGATLDEKEDISNISLQHILNEIKSIKEHQLNISNQLQTIQRDNQALWKEALYAREKHFQHQDMIDKILTFLASVFSNSDKRNTIPRKRKFLLGVSDKVTDDTTSQPNKAPRQQSPVFNLDDYIDKSKNFSKTPIPSSDLTDTTTALNTQSNNEVSLLQNLQNLIKLAQANPDLLNQSISDYSFSIKNYPLSFQSIASDNPVTPLPSDSINDITVSADALNQDINDLDSSLQALAEHLGFDPSKVSHSTLMQAHDSVKNSQQDDSLLILNEFLNPYNDADDTFNNNIPSESQLNQ